MLLFRNVLFRQELLTMATRMIVRRAEAAAIWLSVDEKSASIGGNAKR